MVLKVFWPVDHGSDEYRHDDLGEADNDGRQEGIDRAVGRLEDVDRVEENRVHAAQLLEAHESHASNGGPTSGLGPDQILDTARRFRYPVYFSL